MPALSFRSKLLAAMMLVVAGVTIATLWVSQRQSAKHYDSLLTLQFEIQSRGFLREQQNLLVAGKQACERLVNARRLMDALSESEGDAANLYENARAELQTRDLWPDENARGVATTFFAFLDADGNLLAPPPDARPGLRAFDSQSALRDQLTATGKAAQALGESVVGYVTPARADGSAVLQQAIATEVVDTFSDETVGTLLVGFPAPELDQISHRYRIGIAFAQQLFSESIPAEHSNAIMTALDSGRALTLPIDDIPHRLLYQPIPLPEGFAPAFFVVLFSLSEAREAQASMRRTILTCGGIGIATALALSWFLARGLSVPIRDLVTGTTEIQRGNFDVRVPVRSGDEIGRLTASFNEMARDLALKEKYRSVLNMVADKNVAQELIKGGVVLGGETRMVSVLFCDIRGFTPLTQHMDPADVIAMLNEHFTPLTRVVYEHGGVVDKFVGDLIMAVFGAPRSSGREALNAVETAAGMLQERHLLNERGPHKIEIGIGIATGAAVAGCMGSQDRLNYTVLGERVNLASRLCGKAGRMEILVDESTRVGCGDSVQFEPLPNLELKGFSGAVQAHKFRKLN